MSQGSRKPLIDIESGGTILTAVWPLVRSDTARNVANASTPVTSSSSDETSSGSQAPTAPSLTTARDTSKLTRSRLCSTKSSSPIGSTSYSTFGLRAATSTGSLVGRAASTSRYSEDVDEATATTTHRSSRDDPTPTRNVSSLSSW